ncbi:hypothetical protein T11_3377 [Trichinella zimbabwensis]|uniref:Uncharacterized protein n=1 Tax=Trichinella zimbabwensis TaxID=268475 RepID=A0A0V1I3M2_9BILA|nr:hypothetical protein T11_3377 [Trichinella zimbabwensis]
MTRRYSDFYTFNEQKLFKFVVQITSIVDPIRSDVKYVENAVICMPDTLFDSVCSVSDGLKKLKRTEIIIK